MRAKRCALLIFTIEDGSIIASNPGAKTRVKCGSGLLEFLAQVDDYTDAEILKSRLRTLVGLRADQLWRGLIADGLLVVEDDSLAEQGDRLVGGLMTDWGPIATAYHLAIKNCAFLDPDSAGELLVQRMTEKGHLLDESSDQPEARIELDQPDESRALVQHLVERRSNREFGDEPLSFMQLSYLIYAGAAEVGHVDVPILGRRPLTCAPSGGAIHPYDIYVLARSCEKLDPAVYRYDPSAHALAFSSELPEEPFERLLGNQPWANDASCIIFLVAKLSKMTVKYPHPNAYRVALIEAGHIAQNMLLVAAEEGLNAFPTCAFNDELVESALAITDPCSAVEYAVVAGPRSN